MLIYIVKLFINTYTVSMQRGYLILWLLFLLSIRLNAQVSHPSGFYNTDSLYFTLHWNVSGGQQLQVSVNDFTDNSWQPYAAGYWLKSRSSTANTWENMVYASEPCQYPFSDTLSSGDRYKVNVVRARLVDMSTQKVLKDSVYNIGVGIYPHTGYHAFFITVDSAEFANMMKRYDEDIRLRAYLTLFSPAGKVEAQQPVEFYIAAGSSACIANKGFSIKAEDGAPVYGKKNIKTSVLSHDGSLVEEKKIKLRSGNGGQYSSFGIHETTQRILDDSRITAGGVRNNVAKLYVNGSYWSLTFPQHQSDNERQLAAKWDVNKDSIDIFPQMNYQIYFDSLYAGYKIIGSDSIEGTFIHFDFGYDSASTAIYQALGFPMIQFAPAADNDLNNVVIVQNPDGQKKIIFSAEEGNAARFQPIAQRLNQMIFDTTTNHYAELTALIDLDGWLRYIAFVNYFNLDDAINNNIAIAMSHANKPVLIGTDWDNAGIWGDIYTNNWDSKILYDKFRYSDGFLYQAIRLILRLPETQERLIIIYQDMLNQVLHPSRTIPIVNEMKSRILPVYPMHHHAWGGSPNGGQMPEGVEAIYEQYTDFISRRNSTAVSILNDRWQPSRNLSFHSDYHPVSVLFDSLNIPATVILNKDTIMHLTDNFTGYYWKYPCITVDINGQNVYVKEYPDSGQHFMICPDSITTLTLVEKAVVSTVLTNKKSSIQMFPNPADGDVFIHNAQGQVVLFDMSGNQVLKGIINDDTTYKLSLSDLPDGVYIVRIIKPDGNIDTAELVKASK